MYSSVCLSPIIFENKKNFSKIKSLLESIKRNGFLIMDDKEIINSKYKQILQNKFKEKIDEDEKKDLEILLSYLNTNLDNNIIYIGEIENNDFLSSMYKKIKSLKIVKYLNSQKYYNLKNKLNFFFIVASKEKNENESFQKQKYSVYIEDYEYSSQKLTFDHFLEGVEITNKQCDDIFYNWLNPILWNVKKIKFFSKDISTHDEKYKFHSINNFKNYVHYILNILNETNDNFKKVEISIVTGSSKKEHQYEIKSELEAQLINFFKKIFPGINIKLFFKTKIEDINLIHGRFIVADNVCLKFEKNPEIKEKCINDSCENKITYIFEKKIKCKTCLSIQDSGSEDLFFEGTIYNSLTRDSKYLMHANKLTEKVI